MPKPDDNDLAKFGVNRIPHIVRQMRYLRPALANATMGDYDQWQLV